MANDLFTQSGKRKYLTSEERDRFITAANSHERGEVRTLCLVLAYTGCRISEALQLTADRVDLSAKAIRFELSNSAVERHTGPFRSLIGLCCKNLEKSEKCV